MFFTWRKRSAGRKGARRVVPLGRRLATFERLEPRSMLAAESVALADVWSGQARFDIDETSGVLGADFNMHFIAPARDSMMLEGDELLNTYYILNSSNSSGPIWETGLATSTDGISFGNLGRVLSVGPSGSFDRRIASFSSVWRDGGTWYMVYEGAGSSSSYPGDVGLAVSQDGVNWTRDADPILDHRDGKSWESANIGTPALFKIDGVWHLFYHGYNGTDVRIGLATGTDLRGLVRANNGDPILLTNSGSWEEGTVGWRSIVKEGEYYYMVYEGSTDQPFSSARWSSGLARSRDLIQWEKLAANPVLPRTSSGFGYDGPQWVRTADGELHIYFRNKSGGTRRATLIQNTPPEPGQVLRFEAETDLQHQIGRADADGWSASKSPDRSGYLTYGPYTDMIPAGSQHATFRLLINNRTKDNKSVVTLDVYDATAGAVVAKRSVRRGEFQATFQYQDFSLDFNSPGAGHQLEFRAYWRDLAYIRQDWVEVTTNSVAPPPSEPAPVPPPGPTPGTSPVIYQAETDLSHQIGRADADGWSASTSQDGKGYLTYGPYTTSLASGPHTATFRLMVDNHTNDNLTVVKLDVYDATASRVLAQVSVKRQQFTSSWSYQDFLLNFDAPGQGHQLEFRTYWHDVSYVRQDWVAVGPSA